MFASSALSRERVPHNHCFHEGETKEHLLANLLVGVLFLHSNFFQAVLRHLE